MKPKSFTYSGKRDSLWLFLKLIPSVVSLMAIRAQLYIPSLTGSLRSCDPIIRKWDVTEKLGARCAAEDLLKGLTFFCKTVHRDHMSTGGLNMVKSS